LHVHLQSQHFGPTRARPSRANILNLRCQYRFALTRTKILRTRESTYSSYHTRKFQIGPTPSGKKIHHQTTRTVHCNRRLLPSIIIRRRLTFVFLLDSPTDRRYLRSSQKAIESRSETSSVVHQQQQPTVRRFPTWPVPSKPLASRLEERLRGSSK